MRSPRPAPPSRRRRAVVRTAVAAAAALVVALTAAVLTSPAQALGVGGTSSPVTGNATHFDGLGAPYGGCGVPQANLDSQDFIALNVFNTPGNYNQFTRPVPPAQASILGMFDNGLNCGRWVKVSIGDLCTGTNDGAPNQPFCRNGSWVADKYNGATLNMLVADSCADSNAWCRDDPYHIDLHTDSINRFQLNGSAVGDLLNHWNNRQVSWQFISAPGYSGDINIGFMQGAQVYWPAISVSHLANGIHGVQYLSASGTWVSAAMDSDMGQSYIIAPTATAGSSYQIRVTDASDNLINGGQVYSFSLPSSCGGSCSAAYTQVPYTTTPGSGPSSPSSSPSTTPSTSASSPSTPPSSPSSSGPSTPPSSPSSSAPASGCSVTSSVTGSWSSGYQLAFTVTNTGKVASSQWAVRFSFAGSQTIANSWNVTATQSGQAVTANSVSYNGSLAPGAATSWGMVVNGANQPLGGISCVAS
ncbi:cellulose-binding family II [Catenulispora acidiphila DSM 44928]|uniref:Cellulose-binding family II n=1 Tax=Catenulispora acidiphila (strain DSM 44928 / JCM 14897 / NBRC 102108 / NRRL B-24433 / ID139908) TaxID=479433 RepID=C7QJR1_CATAD|nr:cellulose binding domain-containing protein [Catenulispora acidiphila]ACU73149.1 cellulose-binding family II [Catenulispora acidiphila DSM 44928]